MDEDDFTTDDDLLGEWLEGLAITMAGTIGVLAVGAWMFLRGWIPPERGQVSSGLEATLRRALRALRKADREPNTAP